MDDRNKRTISDDAGNGIRGLRARATAQLFERVSHSYGINGLENSIDLGGSSSLNLLVTDCHNRYVVRVYRQYITEARLTDVQLARRSVTDEGVPSSELLRTLDGQPWLVCDGRFVEVERYIESDSMMDSLVRLMAGLPVLGRIHTILRGVQFSAEGKTPLFANYIEPDAAFEMTMKGTQRIRGWGPSAENFRLAAAAEELAHMLSIAERQFAPLLPRQMVHGDFWDNNVFFRDGRIVSVVDFDFMGERARIDDLALTLYYLDCSDQPSSEERLRRLRGLVDAYDKGLDEKLSTAERLALPLAMARQPLWSIGGWIVSLDDEEAARRHATAMYGEVEWALRIVRDLDKWRAAFT